MEEVERRRLEEEKRQQSEEERRDEIVERMIDTLGENHFLTSLYRRGEVKGPEFFQIAARLEALPKDHPDVVELAHGGMTPQGFLEKHGR
jgi:hypothetical protein